MLRRVRDAFADFRAYLCRLLVQIARRCCSLQISANRTARLLLRSVDVFRVNALLAARRYGMILLERLRGLRAGPVWKLVTASGLVHVTALALTIAVILGLIFLRPSQTKTPQPPTPAILSISVERKATATPFQPVPPTATPSPSATATVTNTPEPSETPTPQITAVTWFTGPGVCGIVDGLAGGGEFVWPSVEHSTGGFNFAPGYGHRGIDISGDSGNDIYASDSGVVIYAGWHPGGYGNLLVIDHGNGYQTVYAHLTRWLVECGDSVQQGDTIGTMGSTGYSYGPHLHFEVITTRGEYLNPWLFVEMEEVE